MNETEVLNEFFIWEENNLTEPKMKSVNNGVNEHKDIMNETKTDLTPNDWRDITDPKLRKKMRLKEKSIKRKCYFKAYREANRDKMKTYRKVYNEINKDKLKVKYKINNEVNKDRKKAWRETNRDKLRVKRKSYVENNKQKIKEINKAYCQS